MADPWISFLNEEVAKRPALERSLGKEFLRQMVLDRTASAFPFPLEVRFRGIVVGRRTLEGREYLLVGPASLSGEALRVLGGVLVPCERNLYPGAVVDISCCVTDPDDYDLDEGILASEAEVRAIVPLEP